MRMNRKAKQGDTILVECEVLSDLIVAEGDGLAVDYYKVRVPGHAKPIAVLSDSVREPLRPHFYKTERDFDLARGHFASLLRLYRQKANLSQFQLSEALSVSQNSISQWEKGDYMPRFEKVAVIAKFLGIPIEELFAYN